MSRLLEGRTAIVTGAAHGVGLAVARHFVDLGAQVMMADEDEGLLSHELRDGLGDQPQVRSFSADLSERLALANLLSATIDAFDRVDILVNAHRRVMPGDPLDTDPDGLEEMLRQNLIVTLRLSQLVARRMIRQGGDDSAAGEAGAIVNISTMAGTRPVPALLGYSIACAALDQATRGLALALAPHRIRVNGISFGSVMTNELRQSMREDAGLRDKLVKGTPLGRIAAPDELVETVAHLAGPQAPFLTGQILTIDGGRSIADPVTAQSLYPCSG